MPIVFSMCVMCIVYGIVFNTLVRIGKLSKPEDIWDSVFCYVIIAVCAVFWPLSLTLIVLYVCIQIGTRITGGIAERIIKLILKDKSDAS